MNLDKFTYGKTPAAIYLAARLNELGDPRFASKITRMLSPLEELLNEALRSHEHGWLSIHSLSSIANMMRDRAKTISERLIKQKCDPTIANLAQNIAVGKIKSIMRRAQEAYKDEQRELSREGEVFIRYKATDYDDTIKPETLIAKSKNKLSRRRKRSELY